MLAGTFPSAQVRHEISGCIYLLKEMESEHPDMPGVITRLRALSPTDAEIEDRERRQRDTMLQTSETTKAIRDGRQAMDKAIRDAGKLQESIKDAKASIALLPTLAASVDENDRRAAVGLQTRVSNLESKLESASRVDQVRQEIEKAKVVAMKAANDEEAEKKNVASAETALAESVASLSDRIRTDAAPLLPYGSVELSTGDGLSIAWNKVTATVQRNTLSGAERVLFDAALGRSIAGGQATVFVDAGEASDDTLRTIDAALAGQSASGQLVVCRWTNRTYVPGSMMPSGKWMEIIMGCGK